jgi:hypothetical protein
VLQQTPSTQKPLAQSPAPLQAVPFVSCGMQWPAAQWLPAVQSSFEPHVDAHAVAPHMYAPHEAVVGVRQVPAPSQVRGGVYVDPAQDSLPQVVPTVQRRQAPAPLHWPSNPQLDVPSWAHSLSGSVPPTIGRQRPSACAVFAFEQAAQPPAQADSQQTLSTQLPLPHSVEAVQAAPCALIGTHVVPAQ